jgi:hypothetical protein
MPSFPKPLLHFTALCIVNHDFLGIALQQRIQGIIINCPLPAPLIMIPVNLTILLVPYDSKFNQHK